jgi:molybdopterin-containing oxidoreductase family iron-sulfur binding subunit
VVAPVLIAPGQAEGVVTLALGFGRPGAEAVARGVGANGFAIDSSAPARHRALDLALLDGQSPIVRTQTHFRLQGRQPALSIARAEWRDDPHFAAEERGPTLSLMGAPSVPQRTEQWAMSIDLSICTGCSACMVACQAENNLLVVGKANVEKSREMYWLRIDTYFSGDADAPRPVHQPMLCQHCEHAPCEYVCPVNATVHSPDGLNEMVYNRCVGTRFCSNNCPYKVRRFNWFDWVDREPANQGPIELQRNPSVTVRERGVMEKCTYCVQRIREAEIRARREQRPLREGEVRTACQQVCPTGAIQFGSLAHPGSTVVRWRDEPRAFQSLHELGTRPRTVYLARVDNPNPEIE